MDRMGVSNILRSHLLRETVRILSRWLLYQAGSYRLVNTCIRMDLFRGGGGKGGHLRREAELVIEDSYILRCYFLTCF